MKKLLIYSECTEYGGSEKLIENLINSQLLESHFKIEFTYGNNLPYALGIKSRLSTVYGSKTVNAINSLNYWTSRYNFLFRKNKNSVFDKLYYGFFYVFTYLCHRSGILNIINYFNLIKLLKNKKPDVLFINNGGYPGAPSCRIIALAAARLKVSKVIFMVNNMAFPSGGLIDRFFDRKIEKSVDLFVTASNAAKERLIEQRKFSKDKCISIPNTLYNEKQIEQTSCNKLKKEFSVDEDKLIFVSSGFLTYRKGFHVLINAVGLLKKNYPEVTKNIVFYIFGRGEEAEKSHLEQLIKKYALEEIIFLPGYRDDILSYIIDGDVFILPSVENEDFPYVNIEAMLLKKPIISTKVAGIPEQIIDGKTGYVVEPNNAEKLMLKIYETIQMTPKERIQMGILGNEKYRLEYTYDHIMNIYLSIFS